MKRSVATDSGYNALNNKDDSFDHNHSAANFTAGDRDRHLLDEVLDVKASDSSDSQPLHGPYSDSLSARIEELGFAKASSTSDIDRQEIKEMLDKLDGLLVRQSSSKGTDDPGQLHRLNEKNHVRQRDQTPDKKSSRKAD